MLQPFVVTGANSGREDLSDLDPAVREIFIHSALARDPARSNVFMFALNSRGQVAREFPGLPGRGRSAGPGRSDFLVELRQARASLNLPEAGPERPRGLLKGLPDLKGNGAGVPSGVRLFIRQDDPENSHSSQTPVVEVVPMPPAGWEALSLPPGGREIPAERLKDWLVWLYPAAIRTVDESKRFQHFSGTLQIEPAGSDGSLRYALLRGRARLAKGDDTESAFEGELQAVLTYGPDTPAVRSVRGVVEGVYLYRIRGTNPLKLRAAIESRPE
jgi:hypothetical protein